MIYSPVYWAVLGSRKHFSDAFVVQEALAWLVDGVEAFGPGARVIVVKQALRHLSAPLQTLVR